MPTKRELENQINQLERTIEEMRAAPPPQPPAHQRPAPQLPALDQQPTNIDHYIRLTQPKEFEYEPDSSADYASKWNNWIRRFDNWLLSSGLDSQSQAISILKATAGERVEELCSTQAPNSTTYIEIKEALHRFFTKCLRQSNLELCHNVIANL